MATPLHSFPPPPNTRLDVEEVRCEIFLKVTTWILRRALCPRCLVTCSPHHQRCTRYTQIRYIYKPGIYNAYIYIRTRYILSTYTNRLYRPGIYKPGIQTRYNTTRCARYIGQNIPSHILSVVHNTHTKENERRCGRHTRKQGT